MAIEQKIFSLEGIDGSGKSTQQGLVAAELLEDGIQIATPTSPSHGVLGEFIREQVLDLDPWLKTRLFMLDISYENEIISRRPELRATLWDRYIDSFYTSNEEMSVADAEAATVELEPPIKTFILDVQVSLIMDSRTEVHDHHTIPEWLEMKRSRYLEVADIYPDRVEVIDGSSDMGVISQHIARVIRSNL